MKTLQIGIPGYDRMKASTMATARREHKPAKFEPRVWFTSIESIARVLPQGNCELLALIAPDNPDSLNELAAIAGRSKSNRSRKLKTMSRYGLVELEQGWRGTLVPRDPNNKVRLHVSLTASSRPTPD